MNNNYVFEVFFEFLEQFAWSKRLGAFSIC